MSTAKVLPWPERGSPPKAARARPRLFLWFPWWIALCMVALAYNSHVQLRLQQRLLYGSQELERVVAESRLISVETNLQLRKIAELHNSTTRLDTGIERLATINAAIKAELMGLGQMAEAMQRSLVSVHTETVESHRILQEIVRESGQLQRLLVDSRLVGEQVSTSLYTLIGVQERINGDLLSINHKTRLLDRR